MCRRLSENTESTTTHLWLPSDTIQKQVWPFGNQFFGDPMLHEAFCGNRRTHLSQRNWKRAGNMHKKCCKKAVQCSQVQQTIQNQQQLVKMWMQHCLLLGLLTGAGSTALCSSSMEHAGHIPQSQLGQLDFTPRARARRDQDPLHVQTSGKFGRLGKSGMSGRSVSLHWLLSGQPLPED